MHLRVHNGKGLWTRHACRIDKPICSTNDFWMLSSFAMTVGAAWNTVGVIVLMIGIQLDWIVVLYNGVDNFDDCATVFMTVQWR